MAAFAVADALIKSLSASLAPQQIMFLLLTGSFLVFAGLTLREGSALYHRSALSPALLLRYAAEIAAMVGMMNGLAKVDLSTVGAIIQANPLVVVFGSVVFLGEKVSWRRVTALVVGFAGVLLIIQPGAAEFDRAILWPVLGMLGLAVRDLTTRLTPQDITSAQLATFTMAVASPFAAIWLAITDLPMFPVNTNWLLVATIIAFGSAGYLFLITSIRLADVSVVAPYRYSRLVFTLVLGMVFFAERPDATTLVGAGLIIGAGLYTLWRERQVKAKID